MRELTSHKVNGLNEAIDIAVLDEPGPGNASHVYQVTAIDPSLYEPDGTLDIEATAARRAGCRIEFQKGPVSEAGVNGISNEALLAIVEDRLKCFQGGPYSCRENTLALTHIQDAMHWLHHRTRERVQRGVEGTSVV